MKNVDRVVVANIANIMESRSLTQKKMALFAGVTAQHFNKIMTGKLPPGRKVIENISKNLGIPAIEITSATKAPAGETSQDLRGSDLSLSPEELLLIKKIRALEDPRLLLRLLLHISERTKALWDLLGI